MGRENKEMEAMPTCYCLTFASLVFPASSVFKVVYHDHPFAFLLLLRQSCRSLRNVCFGGRILGLIKSANHGWLSMITSSEGPLFGLASGPPNLKPTTACTQCFYEYASFATKCIFTRSKEVVLTPLYEGGVYQQHMQY